MAEEITRTTLVIANIHCPSCISTIESILSGYSLPSHLHSNRGSLEKIVDSLLPSSLRHSRTLSNTTESLNNDIELFTPAFTNIDVSLISGTVSFSHPCDFSLKAAIVELEEAGFEVVQSTDGDTRNSHVHAHTSKGWKWTKFSDIFATSIEKKERAHKDNCAACREEEDKVLGDNGKGKERKKPSLVFGDDNREKELVEAVFSVDGMTCSSCTSSLESALTPGQTPGIHSVSVMLAYNSATVVYDPSQISEAQILETIEDLGFDALLSTSKPVRGKAMPTKPGNINTSIQPKMVLYKAKLSIEGMTCSSCVNAINNAVKSIEGLNNFDIDLLGHAGSAIAVSEAVIEQLREEIEDVGYDCQIIQVDKLNVGDERRYIEEGKQEKRTVNVLISGFFCEHCPAKANTVLEGLSKRFDITYTASTLQDPTSSLTYKANPPDFTLRTIRRAITELGFTLSVVQPQSLQDRARLAQKRERHRLLIRLIICVVFCVPTFVIGVVASSLLSKRNGFRMYWEQPVWGSASRMTMALFALATPVQFGIGQFFYVRAYKSIKGVWRKRRGNVNMRTVWTDRFLRWGSMDSLVALGTSIAWASSFAFMVLDITTSGTSSMAYFDTSVFLMTFILAGRYLESLSKQKTGDALLELGKLRPKKGLLYCNDKPAEEVEAAFIELGDSLLVPVGASPPVDCVLADSSSLTSFDEASLTGESRPVAKKARDMVYAGTHNAGPGPAILIARRRDGDTIIDSIVTGVRDAMSKKASVERLADAITAIFVPVIVGIACFTFAIWIIRGYAGDLPRVWLRDQKGGGWVLFALQFSVAVCVVACPCGIGLAAPTAQLVGVGLSAKHGIMPNGGGEAFQAMSRIDAICFDKTGTITKGKFQVSNHELVDDLLPEPQLWATLSVVEQASSHPIALAVRAFAQKKLANQANKQPSVETIEEIPGRGMIARLMLRQQPFELLVGNQELLQDKAVALGGGHAEAIRKWQNEGKSVVLVAGRASAEFRLLAMLAVMDPLREEASFVLSHFRASGIEVYIVSGDGIETVKAVARSLDLGSEQVVGGALPEDKRQFVETLQGQVKARRDWLGRKQNRRKLVAFVGDGINDSIALAQADVSIAQGGGSQAATSTADFALLNESLLSIITLRALSRSTYRRIISNFLWASVYNVVLIPLAAGAFYDLGETKLPAVWASLAMALSSVSVVLNSLLLRWTFRVPKAVRNYQDLC